MIYCGYNVRVEYVWIYKPLGVLLYVLGGVAIGGNKPLKRHALKWTNDGPINEAQLKRMREEYWDTAPKYEGRKEIWEALKGASEAFEAKDYDLAQAILDGVEMTLPHGEMWDVVNCSQ